MRTEMSNIEVGLSERTVIYGLLLREEFRRMLLLTQYGRDYFTDDDTYVDIPESVGVFRSGMNWTVYETDERGAAILKRKHDNPADAFRDAAARRNLSFTPSEVSQSVLHDSLLGEQLSMQLRAIRLAIQNLKKVDQLMCLTENPDAVKEDIRILEAASNRLEVSSIRYLLQQERIAEAEARLRKIAMEIDDLSLRQEMLSTLAELNSQFEMFTQEMDNNMRRFYPLPTYYSLPDNRPKQLAFAFEEQSL